MSKPFRPAAAAVAVLAASVLPGCATGSTRAQGGRGADTSVMLGSAGWLNGALETDAAEPPIPGGRAPAANAALRPSDPWLGTIGLRQLLGDDYEVGIGFAVPNPFRPDGPAPIWTDRVRDVGVGVWLQFDF